MSIYNYEQLQRLLSLLKIVDEMQISENIPSQSVEGFVDYMKN
jgi:hypothetical protein